ncbi:MAG: peptidylprolyl isomerase [Planctomycetes bacterium]|nr:peptidylprolyl isomerase [Planctomycetota bacterium]
MFGIAGLAMAALAAGCDNQQAGQPAGTPKPSGGQAAKNLPQVLIETSMGDITVELWPDKAPGTVKNFLTYVNEKFYDGTIFHRVEPENPQVIQGGGYLPDMTEKQPTHPPVRNEASPSASNVRGTLAMARAIEANSARSQFYFNIGDNVGLDKGKATDGAGYCVFGRVVEGMEILDTMKLVKTAPVGQHKTCPINPIVIKSMKNIR